MPKKSIPVSIGGKTYNLRYGINALASLEDKLDKPISDIGELMGKSVRVTLLRTLFWAGLIHNNPDITEIEAGDIMDNAENIVAISEKVVEALTASFSSGDDSKKVPKKPEGG